MLGCRFGNVVDIVEDGVEGQVLESVDDLGPDDELGEALHEEDQGQVEGEVDDGPDLLAHMGEVGVLHPVKVDEEDEVDGS